jgi:hypothetical protein
MRGVPGWYDSTRMLQESNGHAPSQIPRLGVDTKDEYSDNSGALQIGTQCVRGSGEGGTRTQMVGKRKGRPRPRVRCRAALVASPLVAVLPLAVRATSSRRGPLPRVSSSDVRHCQLCDGAENLDIICWAHTRTLPAEPVLAILEAIDINRQRLLPFAE